MATRARKWFNYCDIAASSYALYSFDKYPEDNAAALYGLPAPDLYGHEFPDFDYTSETS